MANVIYQVSPGKKPKAVYTKMLLPNYDIFDEKRYYTPGDTPGILSVFGKKIGLLICEDMWPSPFYDLDPVELLREHTIQQGINLDLILCLSASPYYLNKGQERMGQACEISMGLKAPSCLCE